MDVNANFSVPRVGVLFVHGIGHQKRGETLLSFARPLFGWLEQWLREAKGADNCRLVLDSASFTCPSNGDGIPAHWSATVVLPGAIGGELQILAAESCWAAAFPSATFREMVGWAGRFGFSAARALRSHANNLVDRLRQVFARLFQIADALRRNPYFSGNISIWALFGMVILASIFLSFVLLGWTVLLVALPILGVLFFSAIRILAWIPPLRRRCDTKLGETIGDAYVLLKHDAGRQQMLDQIAGDLRWLSAQVDRVVVVAHSQGARLCYEVLTAERCRNLSEFVTVGGAIKLLRGTQEENIEAAELLRVYFQQNPYALWTNFWATLDPISAGALSQVPVQGLTEREVTNFNSLFLDHVSYRLNPEQFLAPLAQIIFNALGKSIKVAANDEMVLETAVNNRRLRVQSLAVVRWQFLPTLAAALATLEVGPLRTRFAQPLMASFGNRLPVWSLEPLWLLLSIALAAVWFGPILRFTWRSWDRVCVDRVAKGDLRIRNGGLLVFVAVGTLPILASIGVFLCALNSIGLGLFLIGTYALSCLCFFGINVPALIARTVRAAGDVSTRDEKSPAASTSILESLFFASPPGESGAGAALRNLGVKTHADGIGSPNAFWDPISDDAQLTSTLKATLTWIDIDDRRRILAHLHNCAKAATREMPDRYPNETSYVEIVFHEATDKQRDFLRAIDALGRIEMAVAEDFPAETLRDRMGGNGADFSDAEYLMFATALWRAGNAAVYSRPDMWGSEEVFFSFVKARLSIAGMKRIEDQRSTLFANQRRRRQVPGRFISQE